MSLCLLCPRSTPAEVGMLCEWHADRIAGELVDIALWWALLPELLVPGSGEDDGNVRGKRIDSPSPVRLDVVAVMDPRTSVGLGGDDVTGVRCVIHSWARVVVEEREWSGLDGTLTRDLDTLTKSAGWIAGQPWVDDYARELHAAWKELRAVVGIRPPTVVGRCPVTDADGECGGPLHQDRWGGMGVRCARCGAHWDDRQLRRLGLAIDADRVHAAAVGAMVGMMERAGISGGVA